jgi:hypothetical protein
VLTKLGSNPWVLFTPDWNGVRAMVPGISAPWPPSVHFTDIEFAEDDPGVFYISNEWDDLFAYNVIGLYKINFDILNGSMSPSTATNPNPSIIMDELTIPTMNGGTGVNPSGSSYKMTGLQTEYLKNKTFCIGYTFVDYFGIDDVRNRIFFWSNSAPSIMDIVYDNVPNYNVFHDKMYMEIDKEHTEKIYVGLDRAHMLTNLNNNGWVLTTLSTNKPVNNVYPIHSDIRKVFLYKSYSSKDNTNCPVGY